MDVCRNSFPLQTANVSKKNPIIRIFCISGLVVVPINPDSWSSNVCVCVYIYIYIKLKYKILCDTKGHKVKQNRLYGEYSYNYIFLLSPTT